MSRVAVVVLLAVKLMSSCIFSPAIDVGYLAVLHIIDFHIDDKGWPCEI